MNLSDISKAYDAKRRLEELKGRRMALTDVAISAIELTRSKGASREPVRLSATDRSGGGLGDIGLPDSLRQRLQDQLTAWMDAQILEAEAVLHNLGVDTTR